MREDYHFAKGPNRSFSWNREVRFVAVRRWSLSCFPPSTKAVLALWCGHICFPLRKYPTFYTLTL